MRVNSEGAGHWLKVCLCQNCRRRAKRRETVMWRVGWTDRPNDPSLLTTNARRSVICGQFVSTSTWKKAAPLLPHRCCNIWASLDFCDSFSVFMCRGTPAACTAGVHHQFCTKTIVKFLRIPGRLLCNIQRRKKSLPNYVFSAAGAPEAMSGILLYWFSHSSHTTMSVFTALCR